MSAPRLKMLALRESTGAVRAAKAAWFLGRWMLTGALFYFVLYTTDLPHLVEVFAGASLLWLLAALLLSASNVIVATYRWHLLLRSVGLSLGFPYLTRLSFVALFYNTFVPGNLAGDVVRGLKAGKLASSRAEGLGVVAMDRLIGLVTLVFIALIGSAVGLRLIERSGLGVYFICAALLLLGGFAVINSRRFVRLFRGFGRLLGPFYEPLRSFILSVQAYRDHTPVLAQATAVSIVSHLIMITSVYCIGMAVDAAPAFGYFLMLVPVINLIGSVPVTVGGLGLREAAYILLFTQVGGSEEKSLAISLLYFATLAALSLVGAVLSVAPDRQAEPA